MKKQPHSNDGRRLSAGGTAGCVDESAQATVALHVNGVAWAIRVLPGDLYVNGGPVPFIVSLRDHTITVTDRTTPERFGAAMLIAMNHVPGAKAGQGGARP